MWTEVRRRTIWGEKSLGNGRLEDGSWCTLVIGQTMEAGPLDPRYVDYGHAIDCQRHYSLVPSNDNPQHS